MSKKRNLQLQTLQNYRQSIGKPRTGHPRKPKKGCLPQTKNFISEHPIWATIFLTAATAALIGSMIYITHTANTNAPSEEQYSQAKKSTLFQNQAIVPSPAQLQQAASCLRYTTGKYTWHTNPYDPYIYISFSAEQLLKAYPKKIFVEAAFRGFHTHSLSSELINQYKSLIVEEWINKAHLPIRFLTGKESPTEIRSKNVCFVIEKGISIEREIKLSGALLSTTIHGVEQPNTMEEASAANNPSKCKYVLIPDRIPFYRNKPLGADEKQTFLHETGHAIAAFKHPMPYQTQSERPPYCPSLTCKETVMVVSKGNCPPVLKKEAELLGPKVIHILDPDPENQNIYKNILSAYPDTLGIVDLAAAEAFRKDWEESNQKARQQELAK